MSTSMIKPLRTIGWVDFVDFMMRMAFEQVLPCKSVTGTSDSRKTQQE